MSRVAVVMRVEDVGNGPREVPVRFYRSEAEARSSLRSGEWVKVISRG